MSTLRYRGEEMGELWVRGSDALRRSACICTVFACSSGKFIQKSLCRRKSSRRKPTNGANPSNESVVCYDICFSFQSVWFSHVLASPLLRCTLNPLWKGDLVCTRKLVDILTWWFCVIFSVGFCGRFAARVTNIPKQPCVLTLRLSLPNATEFLSW